MYVQLRDDYDDEYCFIIIILQRLFSNVGISPNYIKNNKEFLTFHCRGSLETVCFHFFIIYLVV